MRYRNIFEKFVLWFLIVSLFLRIWEYDLRATCKMILCNNLISIPVIQFLEIKIVAID